MWLPLCSTYLMSWSSSQICIRPISTKANQLHRYRVLVMGRIQVSLECMLTKALGLLSKSMNVCYQQMGYHGVRSTICDSRFGQRNFFQKASPFYLKNETTFGGWANGKYYSWFASWRTEVSECVLNDWHRRMKFWHMLPIIDTGDYFLIWINLVYYIMRAKFKISDSVVVFLSSFAPKSSLCIPKENFSPFYRHPSSHACQWRISSNVGVLFFPNKTTTL